MFTLLTYMSISFELDGHGALHQAHITYNLNRQLKLNTGAFVVLFIPQLFYGIYGFRIYLASCYIFSQGWSSLYW